MKVTDFVAWAQSKGIAQRRARSVWSTALAQADKTTTPLGYWESWRSTVLAELEVVPAVRAEAEVHALRRLYQTLRVEPGTADLLEEGRTITLRYQRDDQSPGARPFSPYSNFYAVYDVERAEFKTGGTVFGTQLTETNNDVSVMLMRSRVAASARFAILRDFLDRSSKITERYGGQNLEQWTFKVQQQLRNLGTIKRFEDKGYYEFESQTHDVHAWFSRSNLGISVIKFLPSPTTPGYPISPRTFQVLLQDMEAFIAEHNAFVEKCLASANQISDPVGEV